MQLQDRVAVVTGAGQGIGLCIAKTLGRDGALVVVGELVEERGRQAAEALGAVGCRAQAVQLDVADGKSCMALVQRITAEYGQTRIEFAFGHS